MIVVARQNFCAGLSWMFHNFLWNKKLLPICILLPVFVILKIPFLSDLTLPPGPYRIV